MIHDRRLTLARADLAEAGLEGLLRATRFESARAMRLTLPSAAVRARPDPAAEQVDQLLFGERFAVLDVAEGFAWGQAARDGYVGWVEAAGLTALTEACRPTHRITALRTFAFAEASIKSPAKGPYSLNALVSVSEADERGRLLRVEDAGWIPAAHLTPLGEAFADPADTAERFLGTPYLWGGRDSLGIDCSGLVQQALYAAGRGCARDSDLQGRLGRALSGPGDLVRGDLVFWRGHVGMMLDERRLLHANAHHMAVAVEPLAEAVDRIAATGGGGPAGYRRV